MHIKAHQEAYGQVDEWMKEAEDERRKSTDRLVSIGQVNGARKLSDVYLDKVEPQDSRFLKVVKLVFQRNFKGR